MTNEQTEAEEIAIIGATAMFKIGDKVTHPLGMKCIVIAVFDAQINQETQEKVALDIPVCQLQYLDKTGVLQVTQIPETFLS